MSGNGDNGRAHDEDWKAIVDNFGERAKIDEPDPVEPPAPRPWSEPEPAPARTSAYDDEARFVPPTPPPLPRPEPKRAVAWAGVFGAPVLVLIASDEPAGVTADGVAITDVLASEVSTGRDTLRLASLEWSSWHSLDRALADPASLAQRLTTLLTEGPSRSKEWAVAALRRAQLELCWVAAPDGPTAREWETVAMQELEDIALWNRARPAPREQTQRT